MRLRVAIGLVAALAGGGLASRVTAAAAAPAYAELRDGDGHVVDRSAGQSFVSPADGTIATIDAARREGSSIVLDGVVLLGGRVTASHVEIPDAGFAGARVDGLAIDGAPIAAAANEVVPLAGLGYVVVLQEATDGRHDGAIALRVHLDRAVGALTAGGEILVAPSGAAVTAQATGFSVLGFGAPEVASAPRGYPLATHGTITGCPFVSGSTHSPFASPANLESDNALDIEVPVGTPVVAVADGIIGEQIGALGSSDPRMAGLRLHLDTATTRFYYAHLSRLDVVAGEHVVAGQVLGLSGSAAGVAHLHFAQDRGNPAVTVGEPDACPFWSWYPESW